jgi:predicted patatin/cPLA2 family phospholipase
MIQVKSAKVAQELVNEFVNFDISPLVQEMLTNEEKHAFDLQTKKNSLQENIKTYEDKKKEVIAAMAMHPEVAELKEAFSLVSSEIESQEKELQAVYHQISELAEKKR